jgi:outer membrane protein
MKPVTDKARAAVEAVAKAGGYAYVINDTQVAGLPLLTTKSGQDDLTAAVKTKLGLK